MKNLKMKPCSLFDDKAATLTFDIDDAGIIQAIKFRTEI